MTQSRTAPKKKAITKVTLQKQKEPLKDLRVTDRRSGDVKGGKPGQGINHNEILIAG